MNSNCIQTLKKMAAALLLALVLLTSTQLPARADDMAAENIILTVGAGDMLVDGATVSVADGVPVLNGGRVYVPLRAVAEGFGAEVNYDAATGDVTIEEGDTEVIMNTLASIYSVNGNLKWMDMAPYVNADGRTMVPVRFVSDGLGYAVDTGKDENGNTTVAISRAAA